MKLPGLQLALFVLLTLSIGCQSSTDNSAEKPMPQGKEFITSYYSVKMIDGRAERDSLKSCFSCNQAIVYNDEGRETELIFYKSDLKSNFGIDHYVYDKSGKKIGSAYTENDSVLNNYRYEFDDANRRIAIRSFDVNSGKLLYGSRLEYDAAGNQYKTGNMNGKEEIYEYYVRKYNDQGIAISENIEDLEGNISLSIRYEYRPKADSNWVEQLTYYNDELSEIRYRHWR